jgi:dsRNA-specific ribonuclease
MTNFHSIQKPHQDYDNFPEEPYFALETLSRRADFLHKILPQNYKTSDKPYSVVLPVSSCMVDDLPLKYVQFGLFIPSIMRRTEVYLLASMLSTTLLKDVCIGDISLIVTAISASSAYEDTNYQRLEFIGDSILKLCTSVQLTAEFPLWHEGYLSAKKDRLVSNSRLCRAALESGLDRFIITKPFTGLKWRPMYTEDLLQKPRNETRQLSSKVLADVVEALIGAAMVDGGISKALACLKVFLPEQSWHPLETRRLFLYQRASELELPVVSYPHTRYRTSF